MPGPRPEPRRGTAARERLRQARLRRGGGRGLTPIRLCLEARCPNPATARGRCDAHRKTLERDRSRARRADARERNRMYASKRWALFRRRKLFLNPLCELEHAGCQGIANEV